MKFLLNDRSVIQVSGSDSQTFLQSQFSNDINKIADGEFQINSYCQHQGKIIAIIWVVKVNNYFYLSLPTSLLNKILDKLNMFKMMSNVTFTDKTNIIKQYGLIDEYYDKAHRINDRLSLLFTNEKLKTEKDIFFWKKALIDFSIPEVTLETSEFFVPEVLNLDINELGVSFTKGCYPGQEVVARMYYLGKAKRRLYKFVSNFEPKVGDEIFSSPSNSMRSSGIVVSSTFYDDKYYFLGTLERQNIEKNIYLSSERGYMVKLLND